MKKSGADIKGLLKKLTLEEKASLLSGNDFWHTKAVERLGIPAIMVSDGPHGLRKQAEGAAINDSIKAICFPAACASACSFDREVFKKLGSTLADECHANKVSTILGPAINIKRSPLCGRNFEYISEDPYLAGELSASYINAVQEKHIGTSLKHFALNNQEYRRLTNSSDCDERTMREIYLSAFETAVKKSQPYTIMHSYNVINGTYAGESEWLLTDVLRKEWRYTGLVMSDWGAVNDRVAGLAAGQDLEMPSSDGINDALIVKAVKAGKLSEKKLDESCERILKWVFNYVEHQEEGCFDFQKHHEVALEIERESIVLLKNNGMLPLIPKQPSGVKSILKGKKYALAVIGEFAEKPRFQGGGSSHINTGNVKGAIEKLQDINVNFTFAKGYSTSSDSGKIENENQKDALIREAVKAAKMSENVVIFAGLPDSFESEGYDRSHMDLPQEQNELISKVAKANPNVTVVLHNGSPVTMPWVNEVNAIVEAYLGGEAVGEAVVDVLLGKVNPSGKLAESFPLRLEDNPSYLNFANDKRHTVYSEGVFVGYRYYDSKKMDVLFPFGHGLSYTEFEYSDLKLSSKTMNDDSTLTVTLNVKNKGILNGKEVVQLYVRDKTKAAIRPDKELKAFAKVEIKAQTKAKVSFELDKRSFAWYNTDIHDWYAANGEYEILVGSSSRDIRCVATVTYTDAAPLPWTIDQNTTAGDLLADPRTKAFMKEALDNSKSILEGGNEDASEAISDEMMIQMQDANPLRNIYFWNHLSAKTYNKLIKDCQAAVDVKPAKAKSATKTKAAKDAKAPKATSKKSK